MCRHRSNTRADGTHSVVCVEGDSISAGWWFPKFNTFFFGHKNSDSAMFATFRNAHEMRQQLWSCEWPWSALFFWKISATPLSFWAKMSCNVEFSTLNISLSPSLVSKNSGRQPFWGSCRADSYFLRRVGGFLANTWGPCFLVIFPLSIPRVLCPCCLHSFFSKVWSVCWNVWSRQPMGETMDADSNPPQCPSELC